MNREGAFDRPEITELEDRLKDLRREQADVEDLQEYRELQSKIDGLRRRLSARRELLDTWEGDGR